MGAVTDVAASNTDNNNLATSASPVVSTTTSAATLGADVTKSLLLLATSALAGYIFA